MSPELGTKVPDPMRIEDTHPPYATVVFDCDSTLSAMEGIEALTPPEHAEAIARMTDDAMDGRVPLEEVYGRRLELIRPDRTDLERIGRAYVEALLPNVARLVSALRALEKRVVIVSGGILSPVRHMADAIGVDEVHAVEVFLDEGGEYAGFDEASPLARAGGKTEVLARLAAEGAAPIALVGDGATDLEAAPIVARFVAFGGVERRASVFEAARASTTEADFAALAPWLLSPDELRDLRRLGVWPELAPPTS